MPVLVLVPVLAAFAGFVAAVGTGEDTAAAAESEEVLALEQCCAVAKAVEDEEHGVPDRCWRSNKASPSVVQMWAQRNGTASGQGVVASIDEDLRLRCHWARSCSRAMARPIGYHWRPAIDVWDECVVGGVAAEARGVSGTRWEIGCIAVTARSASDPSARLAVGF